MNSLRLQSSVRDVKSWNLWRSLVAEFLGTFILVYIGSHSGPFKVNSLKVGMGFGFGGAVAIYLVGNISGGNINPAVSFALLVARQISLIRFLLYSLVQIFGAVVAAKMSYFSEVYKNTTNPVKERESSVELFVCEIIITFFLAFTVMRMCVEKQRSKGDRALAPFVIGLAIMLGVLSGGEIGGGSMNPAASIGLAPTSKRLWIFIVAPLLGGAIAGLLQQLVFTSELSKKHVKDYLLSADFQMDEKKKDEENTNNAPASAQANECETSA